MADGRPWPRITIVTPSYNHAPYIEETLRSVLLQGYPDLEYIVMDGGSRDGTADVVEQYAPWLAFWTSGPDGGPVDALNRGFARATGALMTLMASDDLYLPGAFERFAGAHAAAPGAVLFGAVEGFAQDGTNTWTGRPFNVSLRNALHPLGDRWFWHERGMMVPRAVFEAAGPFDERPRYCTDQDWLCRLLRLAPVGYVDAVVARFRVHAGANTNAHPAALLRDHAETVARYWHLMPDLDARYLRAVYRVHEAGAYLAEHPYWERFWDRAAGARLLARAWLGCPRIVGFPLFRRLVRRAATPRRLLRSRMPATAG
jgi:glycosyltransferase involved in cell wall biosynthesis